MRALHLGRLEHRTLRAADSLRRLTGDYPDDPSIWRTLGEFVLHAYVPGGWPEGEDAHRRAVRLDPENLSLYGHYVQPALRLHRDSALAARRIEEMPAGPQRRLMERDDLNPQGFVVWLLWNDLQRGRPDRFVADVERWDPDPVVVACFLAHAAAADIPVPDRVARRYLAPERLPAGASLQRLGGAAVHGLARGDTEAVDRILERLRPAGGDGEGPPSAAREAVIQEIRGFRAWKEGDLERAAELLGRSNETGVWGIGDLWRGDLHRELGELEAAEEWYVMLETPVVAYERLGGLYEEMGQPEDAAAAYRRFAAAWENADPRLQPRVEEARERARQLGGGAG